MRNSSSEPEAFDLSSEASVGGTRRCLVAVRLGAEAQWAGAPRGERMVHQRGRPCRGGRTAGYVGARTGQRGAAEEPGDAGAPRLVIRSRSSSNEIEMKPFGLLCDVFLLKSLKLPSM